MTEAPKPPPAIVQQAKQKSTSANSQADRLAKEAARRAVELATRTKAKPKSSGK
jgi:hypothetical protein